MSKKPREKSIRTGADEDIARVSKPGLESSCFHISQLFVKHQPEIAGELTRQLLPSLSPRLGVRSRPTHVNAKGGKGGR